LVSVIISSFFRATRIDNLVGLLLSLFSTAFFTPSPFFLWERARVIGEAFPALLTFLYPARWKDELFLFVEIFLLTFLPPTGIYGELIAFFFSFGNVWRRSDG